MKKQMTGLHFDSTTDLIKFLEDLQARSIAVGQGGYGFMDEVLRHLRNQAKAIRLLKLELKKK